MKNTINILKKDFSANSGNYEVCMFLLFFRYGTFFKRKMSLGGIYFLLFPLRIITHMLYKILSTIYVMEIPIGTSIGSGLTIYHLKGIVVNSDAVIGENVVLNHFITIGDSIKIANGVIINPLTVVVKGDIGENAIVGAGSVVTKDVASNTVVAGCPAKVIKASS